MLSDILCRFNENGTDSESGEIWSVSAGQLEKSLRHYRVFMRGEASMDIECTIDISTKTADTLRDFVDKLAIACEPVKNEPFLHAIQQMFVIDPWLQKAPCKFEY